MSRSVWVLRRVALLRIAREIELYLYWESPAIFVCFESSKQEPAKTINSMSGVRLKSSSRILIMEGRVTDYYAWTRSGSSSKSIDPSTVGYTNLLRERKEDGTNKTFTDQ